LWPPSKLFFSYYFFGSDLPRQSGHPQLLPYTGHHETSIQNTPSELRATFRIVILLNGRSLPNIGSVIITGPVSIASTRNLVLIAFQMSAITRHRLRRNSVCIGSLNYSTDQGPVKFLSYLSLPVRLANLCSSNIRIQLQGLPTSAVVGQESQGGLSASIPLDETLCTSYARRLVSDREHEGLVFDGLPLQRYIPDVQDAAVSNTKSPVNGRSLDSVVTLFSEKAQTNRWKVSLKCENTGKVIGRK